MATGDDIVKVVEAAYQLHDDEHTWLDGIVDAAKPLAFGNGLSANVFDRDATDPSRVIGAIRSREMDPRILSTMRSMFELGTPEDRDRVFQRGPVVRLSDLMGGALEEAPFFGSLARELKFTEIVAFNAVNPDGSGVAVNMVAAKKLRGSSSWAPQWTLAIAHIVAGLRLQRITREVVGELVGDAVLRPNGHVEHAEPAAKGALVALRRAVRSVDRARGPLRRKAPQEALADWTALVDGRWTLVDRFDDDGKRFVVAVANAPTAPDPRALTEDERPVLHYAAMGHTNKLIGYELGIPEGTVATRLMSIRRKLGARTRAELVDRYNTLRRATFETTAAGLIVGEASASSSAEHAELTSAERAVATLAARGMGNEEIARARGCSVRTIANLLGRAYRKLGITSRSELSIVGL